MWKITALVLGLALSVPTAHAETADTLTFSDIQEDDTLLGMAQVIYAIGQQSEADIDLIETALDDFNQSVAASGQELTTEELHGLCQDLVWQLRDDLGDEMAGQLLSRDAMALFKMSITETDPSVWIADVADLDLGGMFSYVDNESPEPDAATSWEDIGSKLGGAIGAVAGFVAGGGPGGAIGGAAGYTLGGMLGAAVDEGSSDEDGGDEAGEGEDGDTPSP